MKAGAKEFDANADAVVRFDARKVCWINARHCLSRVRNCGTRRFAGIDIDVGEYLV
jgi:hypothetical protein